MSIDFQKIINSPFAVYLAAYVGRITPPAIGYPVCNLVADWIAARHDSKLTRIVRTNQWVIRGTNLGKKDLDDAVQQTLQNNARDIYNLYHYLSTPKAAQRLISLNPVSRELVERPEFADRGLVIVGLHLSNFDFILQSICQQGFKPMVLTIPDPQGGRRVEYEIRRKTGMNVIPASISALRLAVKHLEQGGMVLTGMDRPVPDSKYRPRFFGRPAALPTHYISLASTARVPVVIMATIQRSDGKYHVMSSEPMEMEHDPDHGRGILRNAEHILKQAEVFIRSAPWQWNMPLPVWPDLLDIVPG